jgi:hypothetical protein
MTATIDIDDPQLLTLPQTPLALEVIELVTRAATPALSNHSFRSYLFARLVARERGLSAVDDYDPELLFCACALHDIGLTPAGNRGHRFEVDGADVAAVLLAKHGIAAAPIDSVWQAIALNTSVGIVERRGVVGDLTLAGVSVDFVGAPFISDGAAAMIHEAYPRLAIGKALADAIFARARSRPEQAPLFSMPAQVLKQRLSPPHLTEVEQLASAGRWGQ